MYFLIKRPSQYLLIRHDFPTSWLPAEIILIAISLELGGGPDGAGGGADVVAYLWWSLAFEDELSYRLRELVILDIKSPFSTQSSCLIPSFTKISFSSLIERVFKLLGISTKLGLAQGYSVVPV